MKKLLLSFCAIAISSFGFSQADLELVSIDVPSSSADINVPGSITVTVKNNGATIAPSTFYFSVSYDGNALNQPGGNASWSNQQNIDFNAGSSIQFVLSNQFAFSGTPTTADLCVSIDQVLTAGNLVTNNGANKSSCSSITTDYAASTANITATKPHVFVSNQTLNVQFSQAQINTNLSIVNLTGQVVKNITAQGGNMQVDISGLNTGIYILTSKSDKGEVTAQKFMIQ